MSETRSDWAIEAADRLSGIPLSKGGAARGRDISRWTKALADALALGGDGAKSVQPCEKENLFWLRRAIVAARDLPQGALVTQRDILWMRPATGLGPGEEEKVLGKRLRAALKRGDPILPESLEVP